MLFNNILVSILLLTVSVFASNKMTFYGCPDECETQENPSCGKEIDTEYFAALSTKIGNFCGKFVVVMETKSNAKKLVRAKIVDSCSDCPTYHVDLSKKAFTTLTSESVGKSEIIWGIYDRSGKLVKGPYYNSVSEVASSYGLSSSSFISAFKVAASKIASNGSSSGIFSITRGGEGSGSNDNDKTKKTTTKKIISVTTRITTTSIQQKTTVTTSEIKAEATNTDQKPTTTTNRDNSDSSSSNSHQNQDTIVYDETVGSDIYSQSHNVIPSKSPIIYKPTSVSSGPNEIPIEGEIYEEGGNTGATVGVITAVTCLGAGGVGLLFMKKKNPNRYEDLKKSFPDAFTHVKSGITRRATSVKNGIKRSVSKMRGREPNTSLPSHDTYMPADTIGEDGLPRISLYDNPPANEMKTQ